MAARLLLVVELHVYRSNRPAAWNGARPEGHHRPEARGGEVPNPSFERAGRRIHIHAAGTLPRFQRGASSYDWLRGARRIDGDRYSKRDLCQPIGTGKTKEAARATWFGGRFRIRNEAQGRRDPHDAGVLDRREGCGRKRHGVSRLFAGYYRAEASGV